MTTWLRILAPLSVASFLTLPAAAPAQAPEPAAPAPPAASAKTTSQTIEEISVEASREREYSVPAAASATRTETPILDTPLTIQVVPEQVLQDQGGYRLEDALRNVSGMKFLPSYVPYETLQGRGFTVTPFRDGARVFFLTVPLANAERIEVLKGPAAVLYGRLEPGGMVNVVPKRPEAEAAYAFEQQVGSWEAYRTTADATGPLTPGRELRYRVGAEWLDAHEFIDRRYEQRLFVAPSISWHPGEATSVSVSLEYRDEKSPSNPGVPALGDRPAPVPVSRYYGEPSMNDHFKVLAGYLRAEHRLNDALTLRARGAFWEGDYHYAGIYQNELGADGQTLTRIFGLYSDYDKRSNADASLELVATVETFGARHTLLAGVDWHQDGMRANWADITTAPDVTLSDPGYGTLDVAAVKAQVPNAWFVQHNAWTGLNLQDQVKLGEAWHVLAGLRYDWTTAQSGFDDTSFENAEVAQADSTLHLGHLSPRAGVVFKPLPSVSLYASYSSSFGASNGRSASGEPLDPEVGQQWEAGVKAETPDQRLSGTLVGYQLTKQNVATQDLSTPDPNDSRLAGEARSRGLELDLAGQLGDGWRVVANLAWVDARFTKDDGGLQGLHLQNVPKLLGNLWLTRSFLGGALSGLTLGGGVRGQSDVEGAFLSAFFSEQSVTLPGFVLLDLMGAYAFEVSRAQVTVQLNAQNVLDRTHYVSAGGRNEIHAGSPRAFLGSLRFQL